MKLVMTMIHRLNYIVYFLFCFLKDKKFRLLEKIEIKDSTETIKYIIDNRVSVSRFGDGEFNLLSGNDTDFQQYNESIGKKLQMILTSQSNRHIVCIPYPWKHFWTLKYEAFEYWTSYLNNNLEYKILPYLDSKRTYYNASFTRFYMDYKNKKNADRVIPLIKCIWEGRDVCIIEGEYSRLGVGNDLFANAKRINRIIAPSLNAYEKYNDIISTVIEKISQSDLILIALGMTATCLAFDLSKEGYQAIDIGHVDVEYEWYKMNAKSKVSIKNKYVAESIEKLVQNNNLDNIYYKQIIAKIL